MDKYCKKCDTTKPVDQFHKSAAEKDGFARYCKECRSAHFKKWYKESEYYSNNSEKRREKNKRNYEKDPDYFKKDRLWRTYLLTQEQYDQMLKDQNYVCAICGKTNKNGRAFAVDHDHSCCPGKNSCGKCIRGLLCLKCNSAIAFFNDDIEVLKKAEEYIEKHRGAKIFTNNVDLENFQELN